jgi:hypothetical protein
MAILHRVIRLAGALAIFALAAVPAGAQTEARFNVTSVGDSTLNFSVGANGGWVAKGKKGIVVDPRRQDVLIARIEILSVGGGTATAVITGQTTPVQTTHVAVLERPALMASDAPLATFRRWCRQFYPDTKGSNN